jgi:2-polyprenyl-3-methyl-5-hydroxy-6-metoxy-1,4-benzoquinol methylase
VAEEIRNLDQDALALFARKGLEAGPDAPQVGEANAVKVRRVMQMTSDLAAQPFEQLRILDLGCGEGVYAIEAALRGAEVMAIDARTERMNQGAAVAARHRLNRVTFSQEDVRAIAADTHGEFDVVYCLGLLYHLDSPDGLELLERIDGLCRGLLVIDTLIATAAHADVQYGGRTYEGARVREHQAGDTAEVRRSRVLRSIDNEFAFHFTRPALVRAVSDAGFSSVLECHAPPEPGKADDRITLAALKGDPVSLSTYPWLNDATDADIERRLRPR